MIHHSFEEAMAVARRIHATPDAQMDRAATGLSLRDVTSLAILVHQLDEIAQAAAAFSIANRDLTAWATLQEHLLAAGYLPIPNTSSAQEARDGAR